MSSEFLLDVRDLAPPEPLERALAAMETLCGGQYLRVYLHREPFPLYLILEQSGFSWRTRAGRDIPFEIFIWRHGDAAAQTAVRHLLTTGA